jgi:hypothetical protein
MTNAKDMKPGIPLGEPQMQELSDSDLMIMKKDRDVISQLDKIDYPLEAVLYGVNKWTYRNDAYRKWLTKMDIEAKERFDKMIKTGKRL